MRYDMMNIDLVLQHKARWHAGRWAALWSNSAWKSMPRDKEGGTLDGYV